MSALRNLKTVAAGTFLAAAALTSTAANANFKDENDLLKRPTCEEADIIKEVYLDKIQGQSTMKASNKEWDMELFANSATGKWVLLGKNKASKRPDDVCVLASSTSSNIAPYTGEKWFTAFFQKSNPPRIAVAPGAKPTAN